MILQENDLYLLSNGTKNGGITADFLEDCEIKLIKFLFGYTDAKKLWDELKAAKTITKEDPPAETPTDPFLTDAEGKITVYRFGGYEELITGDGFNFRGLRRMAADYVLLNALSSGKMKIGALVYQKETAKDYQRFEQEQIQSLLLNLRNATYNLMRYLQEKEENNPLNLVVYNTFHKLKYTEVDSFRPFMFKKRRYI